MPQAATGTAVGIDAANAAQAALSDVRAHPRIGWVVQTIALLLTAAPIIGVAVWSILWVM